MIVISHSWEFIPKGSSHFNIHTNSVKYNQSTATTIKPIGCGAGGGVGGDNNDSYNLLTRIPFDNTYLQDHQPLPEKWHLKQLNDYTETEIYIKDGTVVISVGVDSDSKIVKKCYSYDSPVIDCNWFNFKSDLNDSDIIRDAVCIFEYQKLHVFFPNGSDFHINLSFKLKNFWKLKDGLLLERYDDSDNGICNPLRPKQSNPTLYSLSHPLNEIKPILCKLGPNDAKSTYWKENCKQAIVDVIEKYDLLLAYNLTTNVHYLYRISDVIYTDEPDIALSPPPSVTTTIPTITASNTTTNNPISSINQNNNKTPSNHRTTSASCLSMSLNQSSKRRLSVSPIVPMNMPIAKFSLNTPSSVTNPHPSIANSNSVVTSSVANPLQLHPHSHHYGQPAHHHPFMHRTFSPMAALSRSPSCSSSPAILSLAAASGSNGSGNTVIGSSSLTVNASNRRSLIPVPMSTNSAIINTSLLHSNNTNQMNTFMTPSIDMYNQCKTPLIHHTANCAFTPQMINNNPINSNNNDFSTDSSMFNEQPISEYSIECIWNEQSSDSSTNEQASKFFYMIDLYNQKYVCYLIKSKCQLRCIKIEYNNDRQIIPIGTLSIVQAKDAAFIESRNLMVILDKLSNLCVFSGLTKLCKLHLSNIIPKSVNSITTANMTLKSRSYTPLKVKLTNLIDESVSSNDTIDNLENSVNENMTNATPKTGIQQKLDESNVKQNSFLQMPIQNEFKSILDSTGSRFTVKLNDNRLVRVNINEISSCKLVQMCLEAFKSTLNKDVYYEIVQQWLIHRYTIGDSLNDQMNLFLNLLVNLCGCFDMHKLEKEMPFLFSFQTSSSHHYEQQQQQTQLTKSASLMRNYSLEQSDITLDSTNDSSMSPSSTAKRPKCNYIGTNDDFESFLNDELLQKSHQKYNEFSCLKNTIEAKHQIKQAQQTVLNTPRQQQQQQPQQSAQRLLATPSTSAGIRNSNTAGILYPYLKHILYTLHLIYEESKLYRSLKFYLKTFIQILYLIANELHLQHYLAYYESEYPNLINLKQTLVGSSASTTGPSAANNVNSGGNAGLSSSSNSSTNILNPNLRSKNSPSSQLAYIISQEPPNLHKFLLKLIESQTTNALQTTSKNINESPITDLRSRKINIQNPFPVILNVSKRTIQSIKIYALLSILSKQSTKTIVKFKDYLNQLVLKINLTGYTNSSADANVVPAHNYQFEYKHKYDIYKNIFKLCLDMDISLINDLYDYPYIILFPIFESIHYARENPSLEWPLYAFDLIGRNDLALLKSSCSINESGQQQQQHFQTTLNANDDEITFQTMQNLRKEEEDGMQHIFDLEAFKCRFNEDLRLKEIRSCLQTTRPIQIKLAQGPDVSDHDFVEEEEKFLFCVCQRTMSLPIGRGMLTLHTINPIPTEPVQIPELNLKGKSLTKKTTIDLTRIEVPANMTYWPLFHNGVAAGLTIHSQAGDLSNAWIKSHLAKNFELTNEQAGFLYGLGLTGHLANFSMLNVHDALTRRHDLTNISILLGLASSKMCSIDINVIRLISMHIKALMPPVEIELEIPYNIQIAALLSLGMVYAKSANKHISYVLLTEIGRLPGTEVDKDVHSFDREAYSLSAGLALGLVLLEKGKDSLTIMDSTFTDQLYHYMVGGHKEKNYDSTNSQNFPLFSSSSSTNGACGNNGTRLSSTNSGDNFANGANYLKNGHSSHIREGESINTNVTSPGATLALGLIYFNTCDKSISEWFCSPDSAYLLDSIRPDFLLLRTLARNLIMWKYILPTQQWIINQLPNILKINFKSELNLKNQFSKLTIGTNSINKKVNKNNDDDNEMNDENEEEDDLLANNLNDMDTKIEAFRHIIAGACMSIALKFAGTLNNDAYNTLLYWARYFTDLNDQKLSTENCLCVVVLSLAVVMAGSGDLEVLRICRYLRSRVGPNVTHVLYGSHMAVSMALSLLFMGGGRYTLKTDSLSVALMICAFYPHFPIDSNDNRFHLQAFRHLYVLASESRLLLSKDVDTNAFCYVPVEIALKANEHHNLFKFVQMAPCILPELDKIAELKILGPRYYSIKFNEELNFMNLRNILNTELYVKQKNGYFSYSDDPKDDKAFNIRNFLNKTIVPRQITPELLENITNEEHITLFAKMLNKSIDKEFNTKTNRLLKIIYESVIQETFDFVGVMLLLDKESNDEPNSLFIKEMSIINSFYRIIPSKKNHIITKEFLISITNALEDKIRNNVKNQMNLIKSYINGEYATGIEYLIYFCVLNDISKTELTHFCGCNSLSDLLKVTSTQVRIEKLLILYQNILSSN